jgi:hypothetical protein
LAWYYGGQGRAARRFFWGCLWKTLRQAPRIVGQMVIYLGMYVHFCKVHQLALSWEPWAATRQPWLLRGTSLGGGKQSDP